MLNGDLSDEKFAHIRVEWQTTLRRTDYFKYPDSDPPCVPRPVYDEPMTVSRAIDTIADSLGLPRGALIGDNRVPEICRKRYVFYRVVREKFPHLSVNTLAARINRDPTTLAAGLKKADKLVATDIDFRTEYERVTRELG